jgi:hypothetical protein
MKLLKGTDQGPPDDRSMPVIVRNLSRVAKQYQDEHGMRIFAFSAVPVLLIIRNRVGF